MIKQIPEYLVWMEGRKYTPKSTRLYIAMYENYHVNANSIDPATVTK